MAISEKEEILIEWPQERRQRLSAPLRVAQRLSDVPVERLLEIQGVNQYTEIVEYILESFREDKDPKASLQQIEGFIERPSAFGDYDETLRYVVFAMACATAFGERSSRAMWEYIWSLAWHSGALEMYLPQAVIAAAKDAQFRDHFFVVAREVVREAAINPGRRAAFSEKEVAANLRDQWLKEPRLSALWRGRFDRSFQAIGRDDDHVLAIVAEIDIAEFVQLLGCFDYPDPVAHALFWCGAGWRFERWKALTLAAPSAFAKRAEWNGSMLLPLLLGIARDQFQFHLGHEPAPKAIGEMTADIRALANSVAQAVSSREDLGRGDNLRIGDSQKDANRIQR